MKPNIKSGIKRKTVLLVVGTIIFTSLIFSCTNHKQQNTRVVNISEEINPACFSDVFKIEKLIQLETTDSCILQVVFKVELTENSIFILSGSQVYAFDINGKFIRQIGKLGRGPNEMQKPSDFDVSPDKSKIAIWDNLKREMNIFSLNGDLLEQFSPPVSRRTNFKWAENDFFLFNTEYKMQDDEQYRILAYNKKTKQITRYLPYPPEHEGYSFLSFDAFPNINGETGFLSSLTGKIYPVSSENTEPLVSIDFGKSGISEKSLDTYKGNTQQLVLKEIEQNNKSMVVKFFELDDCFITNYAKNRLTYTNIQQPDGSDRTIKHSGPFDLLSFFTPSTVHDQKLVCLSYPQSLKQNFTKNGALVKRSRPSDYQLIKTLCDELNGDENPVLIFATPL